MKNVALCGQESRSISDWLSITYFEGCNREMTGQLKKRTVKAVYVHLWSIKRKTFYTDLMDLCLVITGTDSNFSYRKSILNYEITKSQSTVFI